MDKYKERENPPTSEAKVEPPATVTSGLETTKGPEISSSPPDMSAFGPGSTDTPKGMAPEVYEEWKRLHLIFHEGGSLDEEEEKANAEANEAALSLQHVKDLEETTRRRKQRSDEFAKFRRTICKAMSADELENMLMVVGEIENDVRPLLPSSVSAKSDHDEDLNPSDDNAVYEENDPVTDEEGYQLYYDEKNRPYYYGEDGLAYWRYPDLIDEAEGGNKKAETTNNLDNDQNGNGH